MSTATNNNHGVGAEASEARAASERAGAPDKAFDFSRFVIPSAVALDRARKRTDEQRNQPLWGPYVRSGLVTLVTGETSAGKTVLMHNLGHHLAAGKEFLCLKPPRPLRVLHSDFESFEDIYEEHLSEIGTVEGWDFLDLAALEKYKSDERVKGLAEGEKFIRYLDTLLRAGRYDVAIVDSLMEAYPVADESDNVEATEQMLAFRKVARTTNVAVVLTHNSGQRTARRTRRGKESVASMKFLGRGATARLDKVDIGMNFIDLDDTERLLFVPKSRGRGFRDRLHLRFAGAFGYELVHERKAPTGTGLAVKEPRMLDKVLGHLASTPTGRAESGVIAASIGATDDDGKPTSTYYKALSTGEERRYLVPIGEERGLWEITDEGRKMATLATLPVNGERA